mgnify:CR=1 FL=1
MPGLRDLTSTLSNLSFGKDTPGGGDSGQPYIKENLNTSADPTGLITAAAASVTDVLRITKFLADPKHGIPFVAKQVGLQLSNVKLEHRSDRKTDNVTTGQGVINNTGNSLLNVANRIQNDLGTTRIYTPSNTLAEIGTVGFGQHLVRHGLLPIMEDDDKYETVVRENNINDNNRLVGLLQKFADPFLPTELEYIDKYKGGPGSISGIGDTVINKAKDKGLPVNTISNIDNTDSKRKILNGFISIPVQKLLLIGDDGKIETPKNPTTAPSNGVDPGSFDFSQCDFREYKNIIAKPGQTKLAVTDYANLNADKKYGFARARNKSEYTPDYTVVVKDSADKVNSLGLYYSDKPEEGTSYTNKESFTNINGDIISKFRIKAIDNDRPDSGVYMVFRAFINGIDRRIDAKWNQYSYVGRGESFYTYDGFTNVMSLEFTVVALSRSEMKPMYQKLNYLYSTMTPDYKNNKMRGNLHELTIGDYIKKQPGIITSLYFGIPEEASHEICADPQSDKDMNSLPMMLRVGMNFIPLWNFLPHKSAEAPFFGIKGDNDKQNDWLTGLDSLLKSKKN